MTDEQDQRLDDWGETDPVAFKGDTVTPEGVVLTIKDVVKRNMSKEDQPVEFKSTLLFEETYDYLVLSSSTNRDFLKTNFGTPGNCVGKKVVVYQVDTQYAGKACKGVRIKLPDAGAETVVDGDAPF